MDEDGWVIRLQQGDESAFEPLYRTYIDKAVRVAFLVTHDRQSAEDAAQEAFIQVLGRITTLREPSRFRSWFYSILLNAARRFRRKGRRWLFLPLLQLGVQEADRSAPLPDEAAEKHLETDALRQALARLPDRHRIPVIFRYYAEMSESEIAEVLNLPVGTVKSRLHHARLKLMSTLTAHSERSDHLAAR